MPPNTAEVFSFGPFRLSPSQRLLTRDDEPIKIGSRAFDVLSILVESAGSVVSQRELLERAWPGTFVEDVSLRVRMADLRKVLERDGDRYLANVPGRGYSFVAQVSRANVATEPAIANPLYNLPPPPELVVGREEATAEVCRALLASRFLTIAGAGGIGKTTVALSAAWSLLQAFNGEVCFVELSPLGHASRLEAAVLTSFGLPDHAEDPVAALAGRLARRRVLLILDSAEHLIAEAAAFAERLFAEADDVHVLVTTREALRVQGERVFQLPPLASPPDDRKRTLAEIGDFSAPRLFLERCSMAGQPRAFTDEDAPTIAGVCRKLGGLALALEFAAGRVSAYGLAETAALLETEFALRWPGRRTAPPRHQTLGALLDWSYDLLSETERKVLRRLAVFAGRFSLASARHVVAHTDLSDQDVLEALNALVSKSLVSVGATGQMPWFRLLDTTRSYAAAKLAGAGEVDALRRRQTTYYREILREAAGDLQREKDAVDVDDLRATLRWSFGRSGEELLGADLAAYSASTWFSRALLAECHSWMSRAMDIYARLPQAPSELARALGAYGSAEMQMRGFSDETLKTYRKTLEVANSLHDAPRQFTAYCALWVADLREARYENSLATAKKCLEAPDIVGDPDSYPGAEWMVGHSLHHLGRLSESQARFRAALDADTREARFSFVRRTGLDPHANLLGIMSNTFWLLGFADQAQQCCARALAEARALQFELAVGDVMIWAGLNRYLSEADIDLVEQDMVELLDHGRSHSVDSEEAFALSILGLCQAKRGNYEAGCRSVREGLRLLAKAHLETFSPIILAHLCEAAIGLRHHTEAAGWMEDAKARDRNPEHFCTPEILRVRAVLAIAQGDEQGGEHQFNAGLTLANRQGALAWELKTATSAARFLMSRGREAQAIDTLAPVFERFAEGFGTADVRAARETLSKLDPRRFPVPA